jgi:hypothetical protein
MRTSMRNEHNLVPSGALALVQRLLRATDDRADGVLIVNNGGPDGNGNGERVSPKDHVGLFDHFTKAIPGPDGIGFVALDQDAEEFMFDPLTEKIVGAEVRSAVSTAAWPKR